MTRDDADGGERDNLYDALGVARDATKTEVRARRRDEDDGCVSMTTEWGGRGDDDD
jgi:hypothetical protein